ncbi:JmjC domain-containing protein [Novosphingobium lindaniclasticum]
MNVVSRIASSPVFSESTRERFAANYPETAHKLTHALGDHPLMALEALACLAESLPPASVEYNFGNQPLGVDGKPAATGIPIGRTIREIETTNSWAVIKNIEQVPAYAQLLEDLLGELRPVIESRTGRMMKLQAFAFITSAGGVTPYHFDPEHNILLQVRGTKVMTQFPAGDPRFAPDEVHETYHTGGGRELKWHDELLCGGTEFALSPGDAVYVPVMAPHFVRNGSTPSVSLSITWRSEWSFAEADARAFNGWLRGLGLSPHRTKRWPARNRVKAFAWRVLRRFKK